MIYIYFFLLFLGTSFTEWAPMDAITHRRKQNGGHAGVSGESYWCYLAIILSNIGLRVPECSTIYITVCTKTRRTQFETSGMWNLLNFIFCFRQRLPLHIDSRPTCDILELFRKALDSCVFEISSLYPACFIILCIPPYRVSKLSLPYLWL